MATHHCNSQSLASRLKCLMAILLCHLLLAASNNNSGLHNVQLATSQMIPIQANESQSNLDIQQTEQQACDLLFTSSDNLAIYCQCNDLVEVAQLESSSIQVDGLNRVSNNKLESQEEARINQLSCLPNNLDQMIQHIVKDVLLVKSIQFKVDYLQISTNLSSIVVESQQQQQTTNQEIKSLNNLKIDHLSIQLRAQKSLEQVKTLKTIESQLLNLIQLLDIDQLQFLSIHLEEDRNIESIDDSIQVQRIDIGNLLNHFNQLTRLELSLGKQETLLLGNKTNNTFSNLSKLKWFSLTSKVNFDKDFSFASIYKSLEYLSLEWCNMETFPLYSLFAFERKSRVKSSQQEGNNLKTSTFPKLISLNLAGNRLKSLERHFFSHFNDDSVHFKHFIQVEICTRAENDMISLCLPSLTQLDLSNNKVNEISLRAANQILSTMPNLSQLYLQHNNIIHLNLNSFLSNPTFPINSLAKNNANNYKNVSKRYNSRLEYLDLSYNQLISVNAIQSTNNMEEIEEFPVRIKSINFAHNRLQHLLDLIDSRLLNRVIFDESFRVINSSSNGIKLDDEALSLHHLMKHFHLFNISTPISLCDFMSPKSEDLKKINEDLLSEIIFNNNHLTSLSARDLNSKQCKDLQSLKLSGNIITSIEGDSFNTLRKLEHLDLSCNRITNLAETTFNRNLKLRVLNLSRNKIRSLPKSIFNNLIELEELFLNGNDLFALSTELFAKSSNLNLLDLSKNQLANLDESIFAHLASLRVLKLEGNSLRKFTYYQSSAISKRLQPTNNVISSNYSLTRQQQTSTYSKSNKLQSVSKMRLDKNGGTNKQKMRRQYRRQTSHHSSSVFMLNSNQLETIEFKDCSELFQQIQVVWLNQNRLKDITESTLRCFQSIVALHLQSNRIETIGSDSFKHLANLEYIDLSGNQLSKVPSMIFHSENLRHINLNGNRLLNLNLNDLLTINKDTNEILPVEYLDLSNNQNLILNGVDLKLFASARAIMKEFRLGNVKQVSSEGNTIATITNERVYLETVSLESTSNINNSFILSLSDPQIVINKLDLVSVGLFQQELARVQSMILIRVQNGLQVLNLSSNQLENAHLTPILSSIPNQNQLESIYLANNKLDRWPFTSESARKLQSKLSNLDLSRNNLRHFISVNHSMVCYEFPQLQQLNLSRNALSSLIDQPGSRIKGLVALISRIRVLDLSHNRLTWIPFWLFEELDELTWLKLDNNQLEAIQPIVTLYPSALDLANNLKLRSLDGSELKNSEDDSILIIKKLNSDYSNLIVFNDKTSNKPSLSCKSLEDYIESRRNPKLIRADDDYYYLQDRDGISKERCLSLINMTYSINLESISPQLSLKFLQSYNNRPLNLVLRNIGLTKLEVTTKINLISFDASRNRIQELPSNLCQLTPNLMSLDLSSNQLAGQMKFPNCNNLAYLDMSSNKISKLPDHLDTSQSNLLVLLLQHNSIKDLTSSNLPVTLQFLDLRFNQIISSKFDIALNKPLLQFILTDSMQFANKEDEEKLYLRLDKEALQVESKFKYQMKMIESLDGSKNNSIVYPDSYTHSIPFCTLKSNNKLRLLCFEQELEAQGEQRIEKCIYLQKPQNTSTCLTNLEELVNNTTTRVARNSTLDSSRLTTSDDNLTLQVNERDNNNNLELKTSDPIIELIDYMKSSWLRLRRLNLWNDSLVSMGFVQNEDQLQATTTMKLLIVVAGCCILVLSLVTFILALSSNRKEPESPKSSSEMTTVTNNDAETSRSSSGVDKLSRNINMMTMHSNNTESNCHLGSKSSDTTVQQLTVLERGPILAQANNLLYHHQQQQQQQNCSTPSSSLAPSSIETAETMQAVDSINSGASLSFMNQQQQLSQRHDSSVDQYVDQVTNWNKQQQVATVKRMVKSSSANFENPEINSQGQLSNYGTLNPRHSNYMQLKSKIRSMYEQQQQKHQVHPTFSQQYNHHHNHNHHHLDNNNNRQFVNGNNSYGYTTTSANTSSFQDQDPTTLSLISINTALSGNFRSSASQQASPASTTTSGTDLCHYHRLAVDPQQASFTATGIILEQEEEQQPQCQHLDAFNQELLIMPANLPPPPPIRAIEALENQYRFSSSRNEFPRIEQ